MSEKSRVRWLCRRGMKELDVLLERFMTADYDTLSAREHAAFVDLLNHEDPDLWTLLMHRSPPKSAVQARLLARIRERQRSPGA
jgi:antitoxin CptB